MRAIAGFLACLAVTVTASVTAKPNAPSPIYLRGYYRLYDRYSVWRLSDGSPWYIVNEAHWADWRLVKWGYVPVMHDSQRYYCLIDHEPPTGSRIAEWTFVCGDPPTVELLYNTNRPPVGFMYGGPY
jgi:hypothetical protein